MKWVLFILLSTAPFALSQQAQPQVSDKYPLQAHIVSVETEQQQSHGSGEISTRRLMKTEIEGKTYILSVDKPPVEERAFEHRTSLPNGFYPARRTKHGFEFEYNDAGKIRHEELKIVFQG